MSNFKEDLNKEKRLGKFLDVIYQILNLNFKRTTDQESQFKGIDLIYSNQPNVYIDEKAQLDYIGANLPTFTFELSYLKSNVLKQGWLFDTSKVTTHYFLITNIQTLDIESSKDEYLSCWITSVNRQKLLHHLGTIGLQKERLNSLDKEIRSNNKTKSRIKITELNPRTEGLIYFSSQKAEQPINLQLRLQYLIDNNIAKRIYPK